VGELWNHRSSPAYSLEVTVRFWGTNDQEVGHATAPAIYFYTEPETVVPFKVQYCPTSEVEWADYSLQIAYYRIWPDTFGTIYSHALPVEDIGHTWYPERLSVDGRVVNNTTYTWDNVCGFVHLYDANHRLLEIEPPPTLSVGVAPGTTKVFSGEFWGTPADVEFLRLMSYYAFSSESRRIPSSTGQAVTDGGGPTGEERGQLETAIPLRTSLKPPAKLSAARHTLP
jgi:hypothetical protein